MTYFLNVYSNLGTYRFYLGDTHGISLEEVDLTNK